MPGGQDNHGPPGVGGERVAVIDIGTNSTRLLVADVAGGQLHELDRRTRVTRLGRGVDLTGQLSSEGIEAVCATVAEYVEAYERLGAASVDAIATSAVRDASNGDAFIAELRERFGLGARVLDGEQEALLTYRGATAGERASQPLAVIDIGGGSTELIVGSGDEVGFHTSVQAGVVRQTERHLSSDPPSAGELEALAGDVRGLLSAALSGSPGVYAESGIAVAGTATSLAAIDQRLDPYDPVRVHGHRMSMQTIQHALSQLATLPLAERRGVPGLDPDRAPTIVAGVVILVEAMRILGLGAVTASEHDILHGAAMEASQARNPN